MTWILVSISGYFLFALAGVIDKFLLRQEATTKPLVYSFWISILSIFTFVLAPFGLHWPGYFQFGVAILTGVVYFLGLFCFYKALDDNDASQAMPIVGGLTPVFVLIGSTMFLGESLGQKEIIAFCLLVLGGVLISFKKSKGGLRALNDVGIIILAILLTAAYLILSKYTFDQQGFISGFVWARLGMVLAAIVVLIYPSWRQMIFSSGREATAGLGFILIGNKIMAGVGSVFISWAISLGSVSLVNALRGTEYAFLLILVIIFSKKYPHLLEENITVSIILQKVIAIILMGAGLAVLSF
jgi:drug/metabolite transporter (DMT)-like permease